MTNLDFYITSAMIESDKSTITDRIFDKTEFLSLLEQRFRIGDPEIDMLQRNENWREFVPHESSGPCYTYDPPEDSDPGYDISIYVKFNAKEFEDGLEMFLHQKNKFYYATKHDYDMLYLDHNTLRNTDKDHPRAVSKKPLQYIYIYI